MSSVVARLQMNDLFTIGRHRIEEDVEHAVSPAVLPDLRRPLTALGSRLAERRQQPLRRRPDKLRRIAGKLALKRRRVRGGQGLADTVRLAGHATSQP